MRTVVAIVALMLAVAGADSVAQTLRWSSQGDLQTLDPHSQNELLTNSINGQVYETLVGRDKQLRHLPALAVEWEALSPVHWRMKLRQGVKFHDGSPFSADDVLFSVERARDPSSAIRVYASALGDVKKVDDRTVDFQLTQYNPIFLDHVSFVQIMSKAWSTRNQAERPQDFKNQEEKYTARRANGTGPFMVVSREPDVKTVFRRHPGWWGRFEGNLQEVVYMPIKNEATRTAALLANDIDFVLDPPLRDLSRLRSTPSIKVVEGFENRVLYIGMDQGRDELLYSSVKGKNPMKDIRVRKALYSAIDVESIRARTMNGLALPTGAMSPSPLGAFNDAELERRLPFDRTLARNLLVQAGYGDGFDLTLDCPNNRYINDEAICVAVAAMWSQVGVRTKVNAMPRAQYFPKLEKLDTSAYLFGWGGTIWDMEVTITPVLHSRGAGGVGYFNFANYINPKLDGLAEASSRERDPGKREGLIKAVLKEQGEQVHYIPLHRQVIPWAMRSDVNAVHRPDNWLEWQWISMSGAR
jgi:peptide/nickel transport system substrate-binding protein